jgi:mannose-6-phosphate isomerase
VLPREPADFIFVPLSQGCFAANEAIGLGECVALRRAEKIMLAPGARALLCWPV